MKKNIEVLLDFPSLPLLPTNVAAFVDTGATDCFISQEFLKRNKISSKKLSSPRFLMMFDGTISKNNKICDFVELEVKFAPNISYNIPFLVLPVNNSYDVVLGINFLKNSKAFLDFTTSTLNFPSSNQIAEKEQNNALTISLCDNSNRLEDGTKSSFIQSSDSVKDEMISLPK